MRVTPVSKEVADAGGSSEPFKAGDYDFIIAAAEETMSKAGNDMLKLTLHVFSRENEKRVVFDYILSSEAGAWKARHMMEAIGMVRQYDQGDIDPVAIQGRPGRLKLRVKPADGQYSAQNAVVDYLLTALASPVNTAPSARSKAKAPAGDLDDEIPF